MFPYSSESFDAHDLIDSPAFKTGRVSTASPGPVYVTVLPPGVFAYSIEPPRVSRRGVRPTRTPAHGVEIKFCQIDAGAEEVPAPPCRASSFPTIQRRSIRLVCPAQHHQSCVARAL